jgi:hypothetical protein
MSMTTDRPSRPGPEASVNGTAKVAEELDAVSIADRWAADYAERLRAATQERLAARSGGANSLLPAIGAPIVGPYVAFDIAMTSPLQFGGPPPYQPSKVIAAGEPAFIFAFLFVNPTVDVGNGFAVPPTVQLSGREYRMRLEQVNLSTVANVPGQTKPGTFSSPADFLTVETFKLATPDPGANPALIEANVTVDVVGFAQPYAAFATTFFDFDGDPGSLFVPPETPGWRRDLPNRYLVYSE